MTILGTQDHTPDLAAAQNNKYHRLAGAIHLKPGQKLLERSGLPNSRQDLCAGWSGSPSARKTRFCAGSDPERRPCRRVEIRLQDYRDERDRYDRIASIEMNRAVGDSSADLFFASPRPAAAGRSRRHSRPSTIQDSLSRPTAAEVDFNPALRFSRRLLPSPKVLNRLASSSAFRISNAFSGKFMPRRLAIWRSNFPRPAEPDGHRASTTGFGGYGILHSLIARRIVRREISMCARWLVRRNRKGARKRLATSSLACAACGGPLGSLGDQTTTGTFPT